MLRSIMNVSMKYETFRHLSLRVTNYSILLLNDDFKPLVNITILFILNSYYIGLNPH